MIAYLIAYVNKMCYYAYGMAKTKTFLYRIENPTIPASPDGVISDSRIVGQWFTDAPRNTIGYLKKSRRASGAQLVIATIDGDPTNYHASKHPIASAMDFEADNYIIPRDGSVQTHTIALDGLVGHLNPNNIRQRPEIEATILLAAQHTHPKIPTHSENSRTQTT
jgi:hypothetical protein